MIDVAAAAEHRASARSRDFDLDIDPGAPMASLDLATQQLVVIARALAKKARLLILDEPTAALTESEVARLFERMRALKARGVAIIFVSHRLAEVFAISDRIVVMRDGRIRGRHQAADVSRRDDRRRDDRRCSTAPTARRRSARSPAHRAWRRGASACSSPRGGSARRRARPRPCDEGEVVGLFGLLGAGCIEAALAIYGAYPGTAATARSWSTASGSRSPDPTMPWRSASG